MAVKMSMNLNPQKSLWDPQEFPALSDRHSREITPRTSPLELTQNHPIEVSGMLSKKGLESSVSCFIWEHTGTQILQK